MHMFATSTAEQVLQMGQKAALVETESMWSDQLAGQACNGVPERYWEAAAPPRTAIVITEG